MLPPRRPGYVSARCPSRIFDRIMGTAATGLYLNSETEF
jgi:hypothetical protein